MYTHVFFDLDGTLIDSCPGIINSVQYALKQFGIVAHDNDLLPFIGPPLLYSFQQYCGMDITQAHKAVAAYREYYRQRGIFECTVYEGVPELLSTVRAAGKVISLATSKPDIFARSILEHFHLDGFFDVIGGATLNGDRDSKQAVLEYVCATLHHKDMRTCVLVGDRQYDVQGAQALGMDCVGVLYGYGAQAEFTSSAVVRMCNTVKEVQHFLLQ